MSQPATPVPCRQSPLARADYEGLRDLVHARTGIVLETGKEAMLEARLLPLAEARGISTLAQLVALLRRKGETPLHAEVIDAIATKETMFFRDPAAFETLRTIVLPELHARREAERRLDIWSLGCSTGQEPYSIAMAILELPRLFDRWDIRIRGMDFSASALDRARSGCYSSLEVGRGLPMPLLREFFHELEGRWQLSKKVRDLVEFQEFNLVSEWPSLPAADVIFLRNVLIYFDLPTRRAVLARTRAQVKSDGYLVLGGTETSLGVEPPLVPVESKGSRWYRP